MAVSTFETLPVPAVCVR